jgi:hypothetical protein
MAGSDETTAAPASKRPHSEVDAADNGEDNPPRSRAPQAFARS